MAREVTGFSLEPEVKEALDDFSEKLGIGRSAAANLILKAALDVDRNELAKAMTTALLSKGKEEAAEAVNVAING